MTPRPKNFETSELLDTTQTGPRSQTVYGALYLPDINREAGGEYVSGIENTRKGSGERKRIIP